MKVYVVLLVVTAAVGLCAGYEYHVGVGIADITGPAAEVGMVRNSL